MDVNNQPHDESYDVVVVGAGLGGLVAGAVLARAGQRVLIVERLDGPGGYAHAFRRGDYIFDPAIHVTYQGQERGLWKMLLHHLDVSDLCTLLPVPSFYSTQFPDFHFHVPDGLEPCIEAHERMFPSQAEGIRRFFRLCYQMYQELHAVPMQMELKDLERAMQEYPVLFTYNKASLGEVLDECLSDPHVKAVCATLWPYVGLPPSRLSFATFALAFSNIVEGPYYCQGSFQRAADAFATALQRNGSQLLVHTRVDQIQVHDNHVTGVVLDNGRHIHAPIVVSNVDAMQTFEQLVGVEHLPARFLQRLRRLKISLSACVLFAATTMDLQQFEATHETFVYRHWDHDRTYQDIVDGKPGGMWVNVPTLIDPSLAPAGHHLIILTSLAQYNARRPWDEVKDEYTKMLLDNLNMIYPGVCNNLTFTELATPITLERYTLNRQGAMYGWDYSPSQAGSRRPSHDTPVDGLYLSGHWTQPGATSLRVIASGLHTAEIILTKMGRADLVPRFEDANLPGL